MAPTTNAPKLAGLDHVVIRCQDLPRMAAFYCDILGCTLDRWREELGLVHLRAGTAFIDLADAEKARQRAGTPGRPSSATPAGPSSPNMDHLCLNVVDFDITHINAHLSAHGLPQVAPVTRYGASGERLSCYIADPEGNMVELRAA